MIGAPATYIDKSSGAVEPFDDSRGHTGQFHLTSEEPSREDNVDGGILAGK